MLDFVQPLAAGRQLIGFGWKARRDEPGRQGTLQHAEQIKSRNGGRNWAAGPCVSQLVICACLNPDADDKSRPADNNSPSAGRGAYTSIGLAPPTYRVHSDVALSEERTVTLILYYVAFMIGGDFAAYFLGLLVEYEWGTNVSLIVFLALYFFSLWVAWMLAVWVTTPRGATSSA